MVPASSTAKLVDAMRSKGLNVNEVVHQNWRRGGHDYFFTRADTRNREKVNNLYNTHLNPAQSNEE